MTIYGYVLPGAVRLANWAARTNLTEKAKQRLRVVDWLKKHGDDISLTAWQVPHILDTDSQI